MAILEIKQKEDKVLRQIAEAIDFTTIDNTYLKELVDDMIETVKKVDGAGLAAPQVGISKRIIVIRDVEKPFDFFEMINPEIVWKSFDMQYEIEGCLSVKDENKEPIRKRVSRHKRIRVKWNDIDGNSYEELIKNPLTSRIIQHEIDHLQGRLFIDYI